MGFSERRGKSPGRPRLNRERRAFTSQCEVELLDVLQEQADAVGLRLGTYIELLLSQVHDYHGQYLADVRAPLPTAIPVNQLRERADAVVTDPSRGAYRPGQYKIRTIRTDVPLGDRIEQRCRALDVAYSDYLRALLREAAGFPSPEAAGEQQAATISKEGELRLAEAS